MSKTSKISERDLQIIAQQLSREPRGVLRVERYCPAGHPQVILVYPLIENDQGQLAPFPTIFWLSCPRIVVQIAALEHQGLITQLEALIQSDQEFRESYLNDHRAYQQERWNLLTDEDRALVERDRRWLAVFQRRGIGGLSKLAHVKCLHMQYTHHLVRENVIGRWIAEHYEIKECPSGADSDPSRATLQSAARASPPRPAQSGSRACGAASGA